MKQTLTPGTAFDDHFLINDFDCSACGHSAQIVVDLPGEPDPLPEVKFCPYCGGIDNLLD
ncbi:MAG: hypothetical protein IIA36_10910 [Proteobacteria bacterium]|nr:hypothetical protein [Pseudomonadota bacterium]